MHEHHLKGTVHLWLLSVVVYLVTDQLDDIRYQSLKELSSFSSSATVSFSSSSLSLVAMGTGNFLWPDAVAIIGKAGFKLRKLTKWEEILQILGSDRYLKEKIEWAVANC